MAVLLYIRDLNMIEIRCTIYDPISARAKMGSYDLKTAVLNENAMYKRPRMMPFSPPF